MLPPTYYDPTVLNVPVTASDAAKAAASAPGASHAWKDGSFGFHDLLDTLNPLQHIPVIGSIYRWATGDEPGNVARIVGDGIFGGVIGLGAGLLSVAVKEETGKDPGEMMIAALTGESAAQVKLGAAAAQPVAAAAQPGTAAAPATTASAPTAAAPAAAPPLAIVAAPPHPFIPLFAAPQTAGAAAPTTAAEQAFIAQNAAFQRGAFGQGGAPHPVTAQIPLVLTGPQQQFVAPRPAAPPVTPAAAAPALGPQAAAPALPPNAPIDIPQRMMDALDKYARMQQQQQRGQQVDVSP
jgi:hypothetical protein